MSSETTPEAVALLPIEELEIKRDPHDTAELAGLNYVSDDEPGYSRRRSGKAFAYYDLNGRRITDRAEIERINALAIPPAYTGVWICPDPNGHLQATGRDERGRKQSRYHPRWREARDETKFVRTIAFAAALPRIRKTTEKHLAQGGFGRERVLATLVQLLEKTAIRIGNEEYARANDSVGLTTMRNGNVEVAGTQTHFHFKGKSGKWHDIDLRDRKLAGVIRKLQDLPGQSLFQFRDSEGTLHHLTSADVNAYIKEIAGGEFTAKDFRTWTGTVAAGVALRECGAFDTPHAGNKNITECVKQVARQLGNTPAVCRKAYIHPAIFESYLDGSLHSHIEAELEEELRELKPEEAAVVLLLRARLAAKTSG